MKRVVVLLVVVASACGGAAVPSTSSTAVGVEPVVGQASVEDVALDVVDAIVDAHGEEGGFDAFIWASERGYSGDQLIAAALDQRLEADGMIADSAGVAEAPAGSPLGLIELPEAEIQSMGAMAIRAGNRTSSVVPSRLHQIPLEELERIEIAEGEALLDIVWSILNGYTPGQVVVNIMDGGPFSRSEFLDEDGGRCFFLVDSDGQTIVPELEGSARQLSEDPANNHCRSDIELRAKSEKSEREQAAQDEAGTSTSTVPPPTFPWVFVGTAEQTQTRESPFESGGGPLVSTFPVLVEITLNEDGTAEIISDYSEAMALFLDCFDEKANWAPYRGDPIITTPGTHADGTFEMPYGSAMITGTYTSTEIRGEGAYNGTWDLCDDGKMETYSDAFSFGTDGLPRVQDSE